MAQSGGTFDPNVQVFTKSIGETLQQKLGSSLKRFLTLTLFYPLLTGCISNDSTHTELTSLRVSPNELNTYPSSNTLQTLILEGNGTLSDQSLGFRFPNLQTLHIDFTPDVKALPEDIALWNQIRDVRIYGTAITQLPEALGDLPLQTLRIEHNPYLTDIPEIYGPLERLYIANNPHLDQIPDTMGQPETLQFVSLANNQLRSIPESIGDYYHVRTLNAEGNQLEQIPSTISKLRSLQTLNLSNNPYESLPPELGTLSTLRSLTLHHLPNLKALPLFSNPETLARLSVLDCPNITEVTEDILLASSLIELKVQATGLTKLPSQLFSLPRLHAVKIRMNPNLKALPSDIGYNDTMRILSMDQNNIQVIPDDLGQLTNLETLSLDENNISVLSSALCSLPRLEELSISDNQVPQLCDNLASLQRLRMLNINSNPIHALPQSIGALQKLEYINLWDVPLTTEPTELYDLPELQVLCLNPADHYPSPRIIRNIRKNLNSRVDFLTTDG